MTPLNRAIEEALADFDADTIGPRECIRKIRSALTERKAADEAQAALDRTRIAPPDPGLLGIAAWLMELAARQDESRLEPPASAGSALRMAADDLRYWASGRNRIVEAKAAPAKPAFTPEKREELRKMIEDKAIQIGSFTLSADAEKAAPAKPPVESRATDRITYIRGLCEAVGWIGPGVSLIAGVGRILDLARLPAQPPEAVGHCRDCHPRYPQDAEPCPGIGANS